MRRALAIVLVLVCAGGVAAYQVTRPGRAPANPRVFVPSPRFFLDLSPSFRTSVADAYYLYMIQYYGEHVTGDGRLDSLPGLVDIVTTLSPHFSRAYLFGAFGLIDAGRPDVAYEILEKGLKANPDEWRFPAYLAFFVYTYGEASPHQNEVVASWYEKAASIAGSPSYLPRLAARLLAKTGEREKAIVMWGQAYLAGDKYARKKAVEGLESILPKEKEARMKALAPLYETMPERDADALVAELFRDYVQ